MAKPDDVSVYVFDGQAHILSRQLAGWMQASPRFTAFVDNYRDKIRKKVRVTREPERVLDLRSELEAAFRLLNDRRLELVYEPYASEKRRGPDFAVTYRSNLTFNLEVTTLHAEFGDERILRTVLDKLGQMQPGMPNLLAINTPPEVLQAVELSKMMQALKLRVEAKDPGFYTLIGYGKPAAFYKEFARLSGLVLWGDSSEAQLWENKQARPALDEKVLRLVRDQLESKLP